MMGVEIETEIGAENIVAQETRGTRLFQRCFEALVGFPDFAVNVVVAHLDTHGIGGDGHALDQLVRVEANDVAVLEGARLAFVGIATRYLSPS